MTGVARAVVEFQAQLLVDVDGRPVAEVGSPLYASTATEVEACPYHDARKGQPMNKSALKQVGSVWPGVLATLSHLAGPRPTVHRAWVAAVTGIAMPSAFEDRVPRVVSATFKASLGLSQIFTSLLLGDDGVADAPLGALGTGKDFFQVLDQGRWLFGDVQVCAGTEPMIVSAMDILAGDGETGEVPREVTARARLVELAPVAVALHAAHLAACQELAREGRGEPVKEELPPWLRALFAVPVRPPEHVRRLFPAGAVPEAVERYLAAPRTDQDGLLEAFDREIALLDGRFAW